MPICTKCKTEKSRQEFHKAKNNRNGLQSRCKVCNSNGVKDYYSFDIKDSKAKYKRRASNTVLLFSAKVALHKEFYGCLLCSQSDASCLDLHHLDPNTKDMPVSHLVRQKCWSKVEQEITKCIVLCANCHRRYHAGRFSFLTDNPNVKSVDNATNIS